MAARLDTDGLATALQLLGVSGGLQNDDGQQVEMFESEAAPLPFPVKGKSGPKGGRPLGARNRSTDEWVGFYLRSNRAPLSVLGNIASQDVAELFNLLQDLADSRTRKKYREDGTVEEVRVLVDPLAVAKLIRDTAAVAARYVHKEQPKALEIDARPRGVVVIGDIDGVEDLSDELALPLPKTQQNQGGEIGARGQSDEAAGEADEKASVARMLSGDDT